MSGGPGKRAWSAHPPEPKVRPHGVGIAGAPRWAHTSRWSKAIVGTFRELATKYSWDSQTMFLNHVTLVCGFLAVAFTLDVVVHGTGWNANLKRTIQMCRPAEEPRHNHNAGIMVTADFTTCGM